VSEQTKANIYDLGYKRYLGTRRPQSTRWRVIVRNYFALAWRGWWRTRLWFISALIITVSLAAVLYISEDSVFARLASANGKVRFGDGIIPFAYRSFLYPMMAFIISLTVVAGTVAKDLQAGAFEFYFSRPVRPLDYLLGKLGGAVLVVGVVLLGFPLTLTIFRIGITSSSDAFLSSLVMLPKVLLVGSLATLTYAAVPLGFSTLARKSRHAVAAWLGFYFVLGGMIQGAAIVTKTPELSAFDIKSAVLGVAFGLFEITFAGRRVVPPLWLSIVALLTFSALGIYLVYRRVSRAEQEGLGGG
jgi:ABC-type transport system involved in multi-copper enzyme maturation permease subunit